MEENEKSYEAKDYACIQGDDVADAIANIMNAINDAILPLGYVAVGYDNTNVFLNVLIDKHC